jgi:hypothetical protein
MNSQEIASGSVQPRTLDLAPAAFTRELCAITGTNKVGWPADDHAKLVFQLIEQMADDKGESPNLSDTQRDRLMLIYRPLEDTQRRVLLETFLEAGYQLSPDAESTLALMFSATQFAAFLQKSENPKTKRSFITLEKTRGVKNKKFKSLITAEVDPEAPESVSAEEAPPTPEVSEPAQPAKSQAAKTTPRK